MTDKPYWKVSLPGAALCCLAAWHGAIPTGHSCKGGGKIPDSLSVPAADRPGLGQPLLGRPEETASLLQCFGQGPGHEPSHVPHGWPCAASYHSPNLEYFISGKEIGMLPAIHGIGKDVPINALSLSVSLLGHLLLETKNSCLWSLQIHRVYRNKQIT